MKRHMGLFVMGWLIILAGSMLAYWVQTAGGVSVKDLRFTGTDGQTLSALLYVPSNATAETPAPGVLAVHGYINSREVQSGFAIELARRGYVVLALDQSGHGYSEGPAFSNGFGGPAALRYLRSLDIVDKDNIGLEGHSMGGWTVLAAAAEMPDAYRAMVLQGSSTGSSFAAPGTPEWPHNVAVVFAQYDEFAQTMWEVDKGSNVMASSKLQALFGTEEAVEPERIYGDIEEGTARILFNPPVTHPGNHLSHTAIQHTLDWFDQTLDGGIPAAHDGQLWFIKELGTLAALIGFVMLLMGTFNGLLTLPSLSSLSAEPVSAGWPARKPAWWAMALASASIPVLTYYPFFSMAGLLLPASPLLPQSISNQVVFWALINALILTALGFVNRDRRAVLVKHSYLCMISIAVLTIMMGYLALLVVDFFFKVDFRFWFVGLKLLSVSQFLDALVYLIPFTVFFLLTQRALHRGLSVQGDSAWTQYLSNAIVLAGGFIVFLLLQYGSLFTGGVLLTPAEPLNTIVMIQFAPLLLITSVIATYTWRRTGSHVPGALINALFVTWYIVAGQATQAA